MTGEEHGEPPRDHSRRARRVRVVPGGPVLVDGPVEVVGPDGISTVCDRFRVALCTCGCTRIPPLCDTSHRRLQRRHAPGI